MKSYIILLVTLFSVLNVLAHTINHANIPGFLSTEQPQYRLLTERQYCFECNDNSIAISPPIIMATLRHGQLQQTELADAQEKTATTEDNTAASRKSPMIPSSVLLWGGPALFAFIGMLLIILRIRIR